MLRGRWLAVLVLWAGVALAAEEERAQAPPARTPTIEARSTLVVVPTLVERANGELVHGLSAKDFRVLDDGVAQAIAVDEEAARQPVALVVLLETGGAASRQFASYPGIGTMLENMLGGVGHRVAVVTFDSQPEESWSFTADIGQLKDAFSKPVQGDGGAAIYDAVHYGIGMLKGQPAAARRLLLLVSERRDQGSVAKADEVVRELGENNVTVLSATFSPEKDWLKDQFTKERHGNKPYKYGADGPMLCYTFNLDGPLRVAIRAMQANVAAEAAALSGGEAVAFQDRKELDRQLGVLANQLANEYVLSFRPTQTGIGLHTLTVQVPGVTGAKVVARTSYWAETPAR